MNILHSGFLLLLAAGLSHATTPAHAPEKHSKASSIRSVSLNNGKVRVLPATSLPPGAIIPPQRQAPPVVLPVVVNTPVVTPLQTNNQPSSEQPYSYP